MRLDGYVVVYLEILLLSFLVAAIIYSKVSRDLGSEGEVNAFRWILRIYMVMMVIDSFTQLQYRAVIHPPVILAAIGSDEASVFHRGPFFVVQNMVAYIYFLFTTVHAFYVAWHVTSVVQKRRLRKIALYFAKILMRTLMLRGKTMMLHTIYRLVQDTSYVIPLTQA